MPLIQEAAIIKAVVSTPVILGGRITDPGRPRNTWPRATPMLSG
jgi:hypothetical protein